MWKFVQPYKRIFKKVNTSKVTLSNGFIGKQVFNESNCVVVRDDRLIQSYIRPSICDLRNKRSKRCRWKKRNGRIYRRYSDRTWVQCVDLTKMEFVFTF